MTRKDRLTFKVKPSYLMVACIVIALIIANSPLHYYFHNFITKPISFTIDDFKISKSIDHWINDGLMSVFFFMIGLEIKREVTSGQFKEFKKAILPISAAMGGIVVPAIIFFVFNYGLSSQVGWGIPVATDIAIVLLILSFAGKNIPNSVKVFLTLLAIIDDLGGTLIIAFFYTETIDFSSLIIGGSFLTVMIVLNILGNRKIIVYAIIGILGVWFAVMISGIHATIGGLIAALAIPGKAKLNKQNFVEKATLLIKKYSHTKRKKGDYISKQQFQILEQFDALTYKTKTPLQKLEHFLKPIVSFLIVPLFILTNAGIIINTNILNNLTSPLAIGIIIGLFFGKFMGVTLTTLTLIKLKWANFPIGMTQKHLYGIALLSGIGFTMSLFIADLAFVNKEQLNLAKTAIFIGSIISGFAGVTYLKLTIKNKV